LGASIFGGGLTLLLAETPFSVALGSVSVAGVAHSVGVIGAVVAKEWDDHLIWNVATGNNPGEGGGDSLDQWQPGDPLPNNSEAEIDPSKFENYSMDPTNPNNGGKWQAFEELGYDVHNPTGRQAGAQNVMSQLRDTLDDTPATLGKTSTHGQRFEVRVQIQGPNGKNGTLVTVWQYDNGSSSPRLITNWLEVHR
jgi:hypothetical protein